LDQNAPTILHHNGVVLKLKKITGYKPQQQQKTNNFIRKEKTSMPLA
jgi:hypothetical protein